MTPIKVPAGGKSVIARLEDDLGDALFPFLRFHDKPTRQNDQPEQCICGCEHPLWGVEIDELANPVTDKRAGVRGLSRSPAEGAFPKGERTYHAYT